MNIDATLVTAICVAAGLLARCILTVHAENKCQRRIVRRAALRIVRMRREAKRLEAELEERDARNFEKDLELKHYREEEARRALARKLAGRVLLS